MKTWLVRNIRLGLDADKEEAMQRLAKKLHMNPDRFSAQPYRVSIDARKGKIQKNVHFLVRCEQTPSPSHRDQKDLVEWKERHFDPIPGRVPLPHRPVVVGSGPCGLFAALLLAEKGYAPLILEQGSPVEERKKQVESFWAGGKLSPTSNVQFGEGGAGTFSDGKLTARSKDPRVYSILKAFVSFGAPEEILWEQYPHIGTDRLQGVLQKLRRHIRELGGEYAFREGLMDVETQTGISALELKAIKTTKRRIPCSRMILAIGHSARDTYKVLHERGLSMENKDFAVGFRVEHRQALIEQAQYGKAAFHASLPRASYWLTAKSSYPMAEGKNRGVYSFCMCPGGFVVNASSEEGRLCVNGMSNYQRDSVNANSALLTSIGPGDYGETLFDGIRFQRQLEEKAYDLGGEDYKAPVQRVVDFLANRESTTLGAVKPSILPGYRLSRLNDLFPPEITKSLQEALKLWDHKIPGFAGEDALLTGVEARSSAPVRILRTEDGQASIRGIYPAGEGSGYAGGIISSALDGMKAAEKIIEAHAPLLTVEN